MKVFLVFGFLLTFALAAFGQTTKADLKQLRKQAGLPASAIINQNDKSFPAAKPVKIYLAIKHNKQSAKDFVNWVAEWNKDNAAQFGEIQIVNDINDADIAAVQYQYGTGRVVREDSARLKVGKVQPGTPGDASNSDDRTVLSDVGSDTVRAETAIRSLPIPLYSYLITRDQNSLWSVSYSRVDDRVADRNFPEKLLQSTIEDRLKNR